MEPQVSKKTYVYVTEEILSKKKKNLLLGLHQHLPLCDPEHGYPTLDMLRCYHLGCEKTFESACALSNHLQGNQAYERAFTKNHLKEYPAGTEPDSTFCKVCKKDYGSMPIFLNHLARLGLPGFWKKGQTYRQHVLKMRDQNKSEMEWLFGKKATLGGIPHTSIEKQPFETELCLICQQFPPEVLYKQCYHLNTCYRCYKMLQARSICVYCKTDSDRLFKIDKQSLDNMGQKHKVT